LALANEGQPVRLAIDGIERAAALPAKRRCIALTCSDKRGTERNTQATLAPIGAFAIIGSVRIRRLSGLRRTGAEIPFIARFRSCKFADLIELPTEPYGRVNEILPFTEYEFPMVSSCDVEKLAMEIREFELARRVVKNRNEARIKQAMLRAIFEGPIIQQQDENGSKMPTVVQAEVIEACIAIIAMFVATSKWANVPSRARHFCKHVRTTLRRQIRETQRLRAEGNFNLVQLICPADEAG
jgi:hypothetical protein